MARLARLCALLFFIIDAGRIVAALSTYDRDSPEPEASRQLPRSAEAFVLEATLNTRLNVDLPVSAALTPQLHNRDSTSETDDYSCNEDRPCSNGACCSKKTGYCSYGPDACGQDIGHNPSPNDVCWSNCDATAECGMYALPANKTCPLNVCCSGYGFCGMTPDFCAGPVGETPGCQSNCEQPGSGASGGDVQSRVIGYYAAWAHNSSCQGMDFSNIPTSGVTHVHFSFGYITPDFNVAPMDELTASLFNDFTSVKTKNPSLQTIVALGGWTFSDNDTLTQPVYSSMVASGAHRQTFITNLLAFMREYAFDGVDFDWEYPGAPDRGGHPDDGKNFVQFLMELQAAIAEGPQRYTVSFTVPTSYWYLRWFDLSAAQHVDWINVMSYDLHGVWDASNPIGNHVLAHTNLTEIKQALDLFWRNAVPANKLNLGIGFYGRSFTLSDPACFQPGCDFSHGGDPGSCTENSGTLSYAEITDIIAQNGLQPYYDVDNAVKYLTWNQDQWVSYDDADTFKQKADYANSIGLGGLLIWSIDQDTPDLKALAGLLAPKSLMLLAQEAQDASNAAYWQDATQADCYVTDCGGLCNTGFIQITTQPCGDAAFLTRHSTEADSRLCCPITAAPDPAKCTWRGSASACNGHCEHMEVAVELNKWGSGDYCESGNKAYCCQTTTDHSNNCYWAGKGNDCRDGDELFTFSGTFLETIVDILDIFPPSLIGSALQDVLQSYDMDLRDKYCCPPDDARRWMNCAWHGSTGSAPSCEDNHCDIGHQVQLTSAYFGLGQGCFPNSDRQRVYCCDAADGASPFIPVPLTDLFPNPPLGDNVDVDSELQTDNTWGTGSAQTPDEEVNDSSFGFVVLASPEELQISLDKRDGSDWEVVNCHELDVSTEAAQTIQIYCRNVDTTNCDKIYSGYGVPGTILELPYGCGPLKYAVAVSLTPSSNQHFPDHLDKSTHAHRPAVYDLMFDFQWKRIPRDLGDTQMRLDYSNEVGYWDSIVNKPAAAKKSKRSLESVGRSHKRWLEEEWRDDWHFGALSHEELHKRWFGSSVIDWLAGLFNPQIQTSHMHRYNQTFTAKLIEEHWQCRINDISADAHLLVQALLDVDVQTSFGLTIIATLGSPIDLSNSYLYFKTEGEVNAIFTIDALGKVMFQRSLELLNLATFPGATFSIPNLVTVGPNFRLLGHVEAEITLAAQLESRARIASWSVQQTFPAANDQYMPKGLTTTNVDGTGDFQGIDQPTFNYSVSASGSIAAHISPTIEFGIRFADMWKMPSAAVQLVADGSVTLYASASAGDNICPFGYGIDVGARLFVHVDVPPSLPWTIPDFDIFPETTKSPVQEGSCPSESLADASWRRSSHPLKRAAVYGPPFHLPPTDCLFCPNDGKQTPSCPTGSTIALDTMNKVPGETSWGTKRFSCCEGQGVMSFVSPSYPRATTLLGNIPLVLGPVRTYSYTDPHNCFSLAFGQIAAPPVGRTSDQMWQVEHVLEFQALKQFIDETLGPLLGGCQYMKANWDGTRTTYVILNSHTAKAIIFLAQAYPGRDIWGNTNYWEEFVILNAGVNEVKGKLWTGVNIRTEDTFEGYIQWDPNSAFYVISDVLSAYLYHTRPEIIQIWTTQRDRVGATLTAIDEALEEQYPGYVGLQLEAQWRDWSRAKRVEVGAAASDFIQGATLDLQSTWGDQPGWIDLVNALIAAFEALPAWPATP